MKPCSNLFRCSFAFIFSLIALPPAQAIDYLQQDTSEAGSATTNCAAVRSGLVSWWRAESDTLDAIGTNNGIFFNRPQYSTGEVGLAFRFDGVSNYVRVPASASLDVGKQAGFTVEAWINPPDYVYHPLFEWNPNGNYGVHIWASQVIPGCLYANIVDTGGNYHMIQSAGNILLTNVFQHIAVTYDKVSGIGRLFLNGRIVQQSNLGTFTPQTSYDLYFGYRPPGAPFGQYDFNGLIDEIGLYNRALSTNEVQTIYAAGTAGKCLTAAANCTPVASGAVSWWRAESNALDSVDSNNGLLLNGASYAPGMVGTAFSFNGPNQTVNISNSPSLNPTNAMTVECWVYQPAFPANDGPVVVGKDDAGGARQYLISVGLNSSGQRIFRPHIGLTTGFYYFDGRTVVQLNTWYHVALTYDGSALKSYVNGRLDGSMAVSGAIVPTANPLAIGGYTFGPWNLIGLVDELALYNRALGSNEIAAIYAAGNAGKCPTNPPACAPAPSNIISWWRGENNGLDSVDSNNGILLNGTTFTAGEVGQAFSFNGTNQALQVSNSPSLNPTNALTIESWVLPRALPDPSGSMVVAAKDAVFAGSTARQYQLALVTVGSNLFCRAHVGVPGGFMFFNGTNSVPLNAWSHIAMTYDRATLKLYVNGRPDATMAVTGSIITGTSLFWIGGISPGPWFYKGLIDEVSIYNRALAGTEIAAIYSAAGAGKCPVSAPPIAPSIISQPTNQTVNIGGTASFSVSATGTAPLYYQWLKNTNPIAGATASSYTIFNAQLANAGSYSVIVSNAAGFVTSSNAMLTVLPRSTNCFTAPAGIVSWWRAESNALDSVDSNNGLLLNGASYAAGMVGTAFSFNGPNQTVNISNSPSLNPTNAMTVECWVYQPAFPANDGPVVVGKDDASGARQYLISVGLNSSGQRIFRPHIGVTTGFYFFDSQTVVQTNTWYHVALTYDGAALKIYVNGKLDGSMAVTGSIVPTANPLAIGGYTFGPWNLIGLVDELALYNRALASNEIAAIYLADIAGKCPNRPPVARCRNVTVLAGTNCLATASINDGSSDPDGDPITIVQIPPGPYPVGTNSVILNVTDSHGASNACIAVVVVRSTNAPAIACPADTVRSNDLNQCGAVVTFQTPTGIGVCSAVTNVVCAPASGSFFPVGSNQVVCTATDGLGNSAQCSFTITVRDAQGPTIQCPLLIVVTNAHDALTSIVTFNPIVGDNCPGVGLPLCNPPSGSSFGIGTNLVICSAIDMAGLANQCSFQVVVLPGNKPPVPVISVSPLATFPGNTNLIVISRNGSNAPVVFDGSKSFDVDDTNFLFFWLEGTNLFSTNAVATNVLALGTHQITLRLDDTFPLGVSSTNVTVEVISGAEAVGLVIDLVNNSALGDYARQSLLASLLAASASFDRGSLVSGINQLQAFQNKVRAQVAPSDSDLAVQLIAAAQAIIDALGTTGTGTGGKPGVVSGSQ